MFNFGIINIILKQDSLCKTGKPELLPHLLVQCFMVGTEVGVCMRVL